MHLLGLMESNLLGAKRALALQLMRKPWMCDRGLLEENLPAQLASLFIKLQKSCTQAIQPTSAAARFISNELVGIRLHAYMIEPSGKHCSLENMAPHSAEQFAGQAREDLDGEVVTFEELTPAQQAGFIMLYMLADAALCLLAGVLENDSSALALDLSRDDAVMSAFRLHWFGQFWSMQSNLGDMFLREKTLGAIKKNYRSVEDAVRERSPLFLEFVDASVDKFLSIHADFTCRMGAEDLQTCRNMFRKAELIAYFFLKSHEITLKLSTSGFNPVADLLLPGEYDLSMAIRAGFSVDEVEDMLSHSSNMVAGERFLTKSSAEKLRLGNLGFKYACVVYLEPMLKNIRSRGDWFDVKYIQPYLASRIQNKRFSYGACIKAKNDKEGVYDVDLIVADIALERIYLCQIKHRTATMLPYLRDELKEFSTNSQLSHAITQLEGARRQLGSKKLLEKIRGSLQRGGIDRKFLKKIDMNFLQQNVGFIVVHTIENLDFGLKDGIALYEWNTFRNLLRGNVVAQSRNSMIEWAFNLEGVALDDPAEVSEKLLALHERHAPDNPLSPNRQWRVKLSGVLHVFPEWEVRFFGKKVYSYRGADFRYPLP